MTRSADQEMIELKNLHLEKQLDLTRGLRGAAERPVRLERANALRIAPGKVPEILSRVRQIRLLGAQSDPKLTEELGEGHLFKPCPQNQPTWCDLCGEFIWGVYKRRLQCLHCKFICHYRCRVLIRLDCSGPRYQDSDQNECNEQTVEKDTNVFKTLLPHPAPGDLCDLGKAAYFHSAFISTLCSGNNGLFHVLERVEGSKAVCLKAT